MKLNIKGQEIAAKPPLDVTIQVQEEITDIRDMMWNLLHNRKVSSHSLSYHIKQVEALAEYLDKVLEDQRDDVVYINRDWDTLLKDLQKYLSESGYALSQVSRGFNKILEKHKRTLKDVGVEFNPRTYGPLWKTIIQKS